MVGILLPFVLALVLIAVVRASRVTNRRVFMLLLLGYLVRFALQGVNRHVQFFSHQIGGDSFEYEEWAKIIATIWERHGIHYITATELPELGPTTLPPNLFGLIIFLNDGPTEVGCMSIVALAAALAVLNVYTVACEFGATHRDALTISMLLYFGPTFLFYTSDTYKDGLVVSLTVGALASTLRLTQKLSVRHALIGLFCVTCLWYVRFYLVFATLAPLIVGFVGLRSRSWVRPFLAVLTLTALAVVLVAFTDLLQSASERAATAFEAGTSVMAQANATAGGSSVQFDDGGSPFGALGPKLLYTILSPFPWATGSIGFQIGKLDAFIWYYIIYRALRGFRTAGARINMGLLTFIIPSSLMYAMSMANVGLIVRQRLVIVFATAILSCFRRAPAAHTSLENRATLALGPQS